MTDADGNPAMKPFWDITEADVEAASRRPPGTRPTAATSAAAATRPSFVYQGRHARHDGAPQPGLAARARSCRSPRAGPWSCPQEVHDILDERTDPTWPTHWFVPRTTGAGPFRDVYTVMANWGANHGAISYGHIGADLITLASMLRIPVYMHNVPEEDIFRPSRRGPTCGTADPEGADFRACANFGPLYGRK